MYPFDKLCLGTRGHSAPPHTRPISGADHASSSRTRARPLLGGLLALCAVLALYLLCGGEVPGATSWALPNQVGLRGTVGTVPAVVVEGELDMEGRPDGDHPSKAIPVEVVFYSGGVVVDREIVETGEGGTFVFPRQVYTGTYDTIGVKGLHTLRSAVRDYELTAPTTTITFPPLREGDVDNDNRVNAVDLWLLTEAYWQAEGGPSWLSGADLNEDGYTNARDASLLVPNYGRPGDEIVSLAAVLPRADTPLVDLWMTPSDTWLQPGDLITVEVGFDSRGSDFVMAADIALRYDPYYLQVVSSDGQPSDAVEPVLDAFDYELAQSVDTAAGVIRYASLPTQEYGDGGDVTLFRVRFKAVRSTSPWGTPLRFAVDEGPQRDTLLARSGFDLHDRARGTRIMVDGPQTVGVSMVTQRWRP